MKINHNIFQNKYIPNKINPFKLYNEYKKLKPIKVKECFDFSQNLKKIEDNLDSISKNVDNLYDTFECMGMPPRIEIDFNNGTKLLKKRISKEELETVPLAELID